MQRHIVNYTDVGKRKQNFRSAPRQFAVTKNVSMHTATGEQTVGVNNAVDEVNDINVDAATGKGLRILAKRVD
jgi:hypothetical protein